jgi:hypothetical protein
MEGIHMLVFVDFFGGDFSRNDFAEEAVRV